MTTLLAACATLASTSFAAETVDHPFLGVTHITRTETSPRAVTMHIVRIDLSIPVFAAADTVPPSTNAAVVPAPNRDGWNTSDATVVLTAADNPGGAVLELHYTSTGAHSEIDRVVPGDTASRTITEEGVTTVSYFARGSPRARRRRSIG